MREVRVVRDIHSPMNVKIYVVESIPSSPIKHEITQSEGTTSYVQFSPIKEGEVPRPLLDIPFDMFVDILQGLVKEAKLIGVTVPTEPGESLNQDMLNHIMRNNESLTGIINNLIIK